jgi:hypothetical protein
VALFWPVDPAGFAPKSAQRDKGLLTRPYWHQNLANVLVPSTIGPLRTHDTPGPLKSAKKEKSKIGLW